MLRTIATQTPSESKATTKMQIYADRRLEIMKSMEPDAIFLLRAAPTATRNADMTFPYRQNSTFYYLSGFEEPKAVLVLAPGRKEGSFILFNQEKDPKQEQITGTRVGQEGAITKYQANEAFPISTFEKKLAELLQGRSKIYYDALDIEFAHLITDTTATFNSKMRQGFHRIIMLAPNADIVSRMRLFKSKHELALIRKAGEISARGHIRAIQCCKPGMKEYELWAELKHEYTKSGALAVGYEDIVASGPNSCILHYSKNTRRIQDGDIVLLDSGAEYKNYSADITRTFPANGKFSPEQLAIYNIVLAAQEAGIREVKPGNSRKNVNAAIDRIITKGLLELGLLKGDLEDLIEKQAFKPFYMHGPGHWLGLDTHDDGHYQELGKTEILYAPNMVLTIEPGIYISDIVPGLPSDIDPKWKNIGIRIEDMVLVTKDGNEILSCGVPKKPEEIEKLMADAKTKRIARSIKLFTVPVEKDTQTDFIPSVTAAKLG